MIRDNKRVVTLTIILVWSVTASVSCHDRAVSSGHHSLLKVMTGTGLVSLQPIVSNCSEMSAEFQQSPSQVTSQCTLTDINVECEAWDSRDSRETRSVSLLVPAQPRPTGLLLTRPALPAENQLQRCWVASFPPSLLPLCLTFTCL